MLLDSEEAPLRCPCADVALCVFSGCGVMERSPMVGFAGRVSQGFGEARWDSPGAERGVGTVTAEDGFAEDFGVLISDPDDEEVYKVVFFTSPCRVVVVETTGTLPDRVCV